MFIKYIKAKSKCQLRTHKLLWMMAVIMLSLSFVLTLTACDWAGDKDILSEQTGAEADPSSSSNPGTQDQSNDQEKLGTEALGEDRVTLACVGDVLIHQSLLNAGLQEDGTYDFLPLFRYFAPINEQVDIAAFDMEGVLKGPPYAGYPSFSVPETIAFDLKASGFDLAITANNHAMDFDYPAMQTSVRSLRAADLEVLGTRAEHDEPKFMIKEIKGMKIGLSAFTYESPRILFNGEYLRALNQVPISHKNAELVDSVYVLPGAEAWLEEDKARIETRCQEMREAGAEALVFFFHWGTEYAIEEDFGQNFYAQILADQGVDVVIGIGPHVIQPIRSVRSQEGNHEMLCYNSIGNAVSNQQFETGGAEGRAQDGLIALVSFVRNQEGEVVLGDCGYMGHTMYKTYPQGKDSAYTVGCAVPVEAGALNPQDFDLDQDGLEQIRLAQARIQKIMDFNKTGSFSISSYQKIEDFIH